MHHFIGQRHKRQRHEGTAKRQAPHSTYVHILDRVTFVAGVVGPFTVVPQVYQIFLTHSAADVSAVSWALMFIVTLPWIFYGIAHKDRSIIISFMLWEVMNALVFAGALLYG